MPERNYDPNPSGAVNTTGCTATAGTLSRLTTQTSPWLRATAIRLTCNSAAFGYAQLQRAKYDLGVDIAGRDFTAVLQWSVSAIPPGALYVALYFYDAAGVFISSAISEMTGRTANTVYTDTVSGVAPANARQVAGGFFAYSTPVNWTVTTGLSRVDDGTTPGLVPADGGSTGWTWDGTSGASTSTGPVPSPWPMLLNAINDAPLPMFVQDDLTGKPDGPLTVSDTGQPYTVVSVGVNAVNPSIRNGAIGPGAGFTPPPTGQGNAAGYAYQPLPDSARSWGGMLRWDSSASTDSSCCLAAFSTNGYQVGVTDSPGHVSVAYNKVQYSVFVGGIENGHYVSLIPTGAGSDFPALPNPMPRDGVTATPVSVTIDRFIGRAWVCIGGNPCFVYNDSRIASVYAPWVFWEYFVLPSNTNIPRFTRIWADHRQ